jgi:hypothetical protein
MFSNVMHLKGGCYAGMVPDLLQLELDLILGGVSKRLFYTLI